MTAVKTNFAWVSSFRQAQHNGALSGSQGTAIYGVMSQSFIFATEACGFSGPGWNLCLWKNKQTNKHTQVL